MRQLVIMNLLLQKMMGLVNLLPTDMIVMEIVNGQKQQFLIHGMVLVKLKILGLLQMKMVI